jgi:CHRD domain/VPDSG-CTERM motif
MRPVIFVALAAFSGFGCPVARAIPIFYNFTLSGTNESPANASPGTGTGLVWFDTDLRRMFIGVDFKGLVGPTTVAHIHAPTPIAGVGTAGVAVTSRSLPGFPVGRTSGTYSMMFDAANPFTYNPAFLNANGGPRGAELALANAAAAGKAYFNLPTAAFPGGEIRGFLTPVRNSVPDSGSTLLLLGLAFCSISGFCRKWIL